ncbi:MAG: hypothetical protein R3C68_06470 [Myxococcota bacterium]
MSSVGGPYRCVSFAADIPLRIDDVASTAQPAIAFVQAEIQLVDSRKPTRITIVVKMLMFCTRNASMNGYDLLVLRTIEGPVAEVRCDGPMTTVEPLAGHDERTGCLGGFCNGTCQAWDMRRETVRLCMSSLRWYFA